MIHPKLVGRGDYKDFVPAIINGKVVHNELNKIIVYIDDYFTANLWPPEAQSMFEEYHKNITRGEFFVFETYCEFFFRVLMCRDDEERERL